MVEFGEQGAAGATTAARKKVDQRGKTRWNLWKRMCVLSWVE